VRVLIAVEGKNYMREGKGVARTTNVGACAERGSKLAVPAINAVDGGGGIMDL